MFNEDKQQPAEELRSIDFECVRLSQILHPRGPLPISKSSWWEGVRKGVYPQPIRLGKRITAWRVRDIRTLIEQGAA